MSTREHPRALWAVFFVSSVLLFGLLTTLIISPGQNKVQGYAAITSGTVGVCVNSAPVVNVSGCSPNAFVGIPYTCVVNGTDLQQASLSYTVSRLLGSGLLDASLVMNGNTLAFTPTGPQVGNYTLLYTADDLSGCLYNQGSAPMQLSINFTDDNPYLVAPLPNRTWTANHMLIAFNLNDYFLDPNNDPLVYLSFGSVNVRIDIVNGEVLLTPAQNWCGSEEVYFRATDPEGNFVDSNAVTLEVECVSTPSSGGGGGGGASARPPRCEPSYACLDWSSCQLTRVVSPVTGNSSRIEITGVAGNRVYSIPAEYTTDPSAYYEGFEYQECFDSRRCTDEVDVRVRPCTYKPSCSDGIQNQDETGVDCGGTICAPCGVCTDGIQNGQETGVDCGGPECAACNSCTNAKMDGQELGVDCGGPDCPVCATCFDGIQNQDETGVDCGGKFCSACSEKQFPASASLPWLTVALLVLVVLVFLFLFAAALKRTFAALFMRYALKHKKKNRTILIPSNLKDEILRRLAELEKSVEKDPILKSQEELARIIRDYFKEALQLDFEFTYEELIRALGENRLNPLLSGILQRYFVRISELEFSGVKVTPLVIKTLIEEMRELVYQTAVLTIDDLKEREKDLELRDIPAGAPSLDRAYLLLSQVHLCLQFRKHDIAFAVYTVLREWYVKAPLEEQRAVYEDLSRVHDEYAFSAQQKM